MLKSFGLTLALGTGAAFSCSFIGTRSMQYDTLDQGVVRVIHSYPTYNVTTKMDEQAFDTSYSRVSDFHARMDSVLAQNAIVFIATIDSLIGSPDRDTVLSGFIPDLVLSPVGSGGQGFYARIKLDTLYKGALPSGHFWIRGATVSSAGCGAFFGVNLGATFLNFSDQLQSMQDLKLPQTLDNCLTCPRNGHFIYGDKLYSQDFPGIGLPRLELFSGISTGIPVRRPSVTSPRSGRVYFPNGRTAPSDEASRRNTPVPLLK